MRLTRKGNGSDGNNGRKREGDELTGGNKYNCF